MTRVSYLLLVSATLCAIGCSATSTRPALEPELEGSVVPALAVQSGGIDSSRGPSGASKFPGLDAFESWDFGPEVQIYPAGIIAGVQGRSVIDDASEVTFRVAYNTTDRQDFGEHDDETGGGPGFGMGWRRYFGPDHTEWLLGGRIDFWFLEIDWEDDPPASVQKGSTDVIVLQPTVEGGYTFALDGGWRFDLTLSVGAEINIEEDGDDVGEGAIGLLGFSFVRDF